ncbi:MAG: phage Gp37/Gp68 family protein [Rhizobiaceae bacterium]|nr:phage Gp37/Gp68 family protein [Rhizobiaceae bacterium]
MADKTSIEWTDATWNPITGCQIESPGCKVCYAMKLAGTRMKNHPSRAGLTIDSKAGPVWNGEVRFNDQWLDQPLRWAKPRMIFVCAHADLFYEAIPDEWIDRVFAVMALAPEHTFQVLTKRPERAIDYLQRLDSETSQETARRLAMAWPGRTPVPPDGLEFPLRNVWIGTSVEDQPRADKRRASLKAISDLGWLTWVSYEPALGMVDWSGWEFIRWLVSGGESDMDGKSARPSNPDWHRSARDFCRAHVIAFNFKQWGCWAPEDDIADAAATYRADLEAGRTWRFTGEPMRRRRKQETGRLLDGRTHNAFPMVPA